MRYANRFSGGTVRTIGILLEQKAWLNCNMIFANEL